MMNTATAVMLTEYSAWADSVLFAAIRDLPAGEVYRSRKTLFQSMLGTLNHNYQVDLIWRAHLRGEEHGFSTRRDLLEPEFDGLVKAQTTINRWFIDWAKAQTPQSLDEIVAFRFVSGREAEMTRGGIMLHIINHKTYHRGWVAEMFFDTGSKPPDTDLSVYLSDKQPAAVA